PHRDTDPSGDKGAATESLVLAAVGGISGVLLAYWGVDALKAILPDNVPRVDGIAVNGQVLGFAFAATLATGVLVGFVPSLFASRTNLADVIKTGRASQGGGSGRNRFLSGLVTAQLATGFVLINASLVLAVSYRNVLDQPMNFATDEVLATSVSLGGPAYEEPHQRRAFWEELVTRARGFPGVAQAGFTSKLPLQGGSNRGVLVRDLVFDPAVQPRMVEHSFVGEGYHEAMGIPLLAGRTFTIQDMAESAVYAGMDSVVAEVPIVINRTMSETHWPDSDALGQIVRPNDSRESYRARVVGIVEDVRQLGPERAPLPEMYFPHTAEIWGPTSTSIWGQLIIRASGDPNTLTPAIRGAIREIDPDIPSATPLTMGRIIRDTTAGRRFSMTLVALFAAMALLLIVAGIYGVMSYGVSQRTHEIGVRMTLGADKARVMGLFMHRVATLFGIGLTLGIVGAVVVAVITRSMVYGISPLSPLHMAAAAGVMILVALAATLIPVVRATGVDPLVSLRSE
ncbi:FtsX-like permease family protein, partial [Gemmatimonadota bacterium]